ncbi:hypothetical protein BJG93_34455 (plasmid) [Paraburkholderia sprentiae WSM5005]|uniref:Uncharacterized protein n=1 Tax=Paraburkholderia sprentiae WSM5005 TaxID=754502 RepID=A0ACA8AWX8_9BURK|nr:hypothetical protein [Paraburkholderia sprentiae]APA90221.2 hypothetical protein BJG93_34455 [Paraburkholderia sprentiae WSM5005]
MRALIIAVFLTALFGCSKEDSANSPVSGSSASGAQSASLTHQQALDKVYGNIHSDSLKDGKK